MTAHAQTAADLKLLICERVAELSAAAYRSRLRSIVLTGSLARDEATFVEDRSPSALLGDAEFLLVFGRGAELPEAHELNLLKQAVEDALLADGLRAHIGLAAVSPTYLSGLQPHIFAYELRTCGQVVWGDTGTLSRVPPFSARDIPLEDAWRLLCNRLVELLEDGAGPERTPFYREVKLYLDMATSFLVFANGYAPTYRERSRKLESMAAREAQVWQLPFSLDEFSAAVAACTLYKLCPSEESLLAARGFLSSAVAFAERLWRWELVRLASTNEALTNQELRHRWTRRQPLVARFRGWAYVLRKCGWQRSWRHWPRWFRLGWTASPRYCVYAAASSLLFEQQDSAGASEARRLLPVLRPDLASDREQVVWNYHEFLVETRA